METQTGKDRHRQTDRQTNRHRETDTDKQTNRLTNRQKWRQTKTDRQKNCNRQMGRQNSRQNETNRTADGQNDRLINRATTAFPNLGCSGGLSCYTVMLTSGAKTLGICP